jgi:hypothetical protein
MAPSGRHQRKALRRAAGQRARSRPRPAGRAGRDHGGHAPIDFGDPIVARRWKRSSLLAISIAAAVGITLFVLAPGVTSYQLGYTLALPGLITALVWIGKSRIGSAPTAAYPTGPGGALAARGLPDARYRRVPSGLAASVRRRPPSPGPRRGDSARRSQRRARPARPRETGIRASARSRGSCRPR